MSSGRAASRRTSSSPFLVHLTRDHEGRTAEQNFYSILRSRKIEARSPHCLFALLFGQLQFSDMLRKKFCTVRLTEAPLDQIGALTREVHGRRYQLKQYGSVFRPSTLAERGANPAFYVHASENGLVDYFKEQLRLQFKKPRWNALKKQHGPKAEAIVRFYSLINSVSDRHDFAWEREWRHHGNLEFDLEDLVAIITPDRSCTHLRLVKSVPAHVRDIAKRVPVMSPA
jgi:hypothetical protein